MGISISGCSEKTTLGTKSIVEPLPTATLPGFPISVPLSGSIPIPLTEAATNAADETELVTFAKLRSLRFDILLESETDAREDGAMDNFDFLSGMEIFINAVVDGNLAEVRVASLPEGDPQIGSGSRMLELAVDDVDVLDYIEAPAGYGLRVQGQGFVPPDDVVFAGEIRFRVGVGIRTDR